MKNFNRFKVAINITKDGEHYRTVVSLDGFYVNALESIGVEQNQVPTWLNEQLQHCKWFNPYKPLTQQIKALILLTIVCELGGDTKPFFN